MANSMDCIFVKIENKIITLKEFLQTDQVSLSETERKIQEALTYLYKKNNKKPPLFKEFPDRGKNKLTIDCTTAPMEDWIAAQYLDKENIIEFASTSKIANLVVTLAHELKHAEQTSKELLSMPQNNLQAQQLNFLCEAQAFAFENYISNLMRKDHKKDLIFNETSEEKDDETDEDSRYSEGLTELEKANHEVPNLDDTLQKIVQKHLRRKKFNYSEYEKEAISVALPILYTGMDNYNYRVGYDEDNPVQCHENRKLDHFPLSFNLSEETQETLLKILNRIPPTKLTQYSKNAMYRYFLYATATGDFATVDDLLKDSNFDFDLDEDQKEYIVDMMIDHHAEECLYMLTDGWDKDKVSKEAQYHYLKYRLKQGGTIDEIFTDNLDDENTVNAVFFDINLEATNIDKKNPTISFQSLKAVDEKASKTISFFVNDVEEEICDIYPLSRIVKLKEATVYGHTKSTKILLDSLKEVDPDGLNVVFSNMSFSWKHIAKLPPEQKKYISENSKEILFNFLDLKNEKGNFIIRPSALKKFITYADQKTLETLSLYQQNNPMDQRFSKIKLPQKSRNNLMRKRLLSLTSDKRSEQKPCLIAKHRKGKTVPDSSRKKE